jgi:FAD/FMN-containing dehydrogenase
MDGVSERDVTMLPRRRFLLGATTLPWLSVGCARKVVERKSTVVNDVHSRLNSTRVAGIATPRTVADLPEVVRRARRDGHAISIAGGRHAMGGQQFGEGTILVDTRAMQRVVSFDADEGRVEVECGIQWPELIAELLRRQADRSRQWSIVQKQTGADRLSIGGAIAANIHGRGLALRPFVGDLESFTVVDATGGQRRCSRRENAELFRLVAGGYGLFGIVATATLRLAPRRKLERVVEIIDMDGLSDAFERRIRQGFLFGDCQYATDTSSADFLRRGVFSCYRPVDDARAMPAEQKELSAADWDRLLYLSHTDKRRAFETYAAYYVSTSGQLYWSDTTQLGVYLDDYHVALDRRLGASEPATEMITEIYVPRAALGAFLADVRTDFRRHRVDLIYGTIRLIERDDETMLAWAREPWACIIFNLHTVHGGAGLAQSAEAFRRLIDLAITRGGSYFLTYHRFATRPQVEACYPQFADFLRRKRQHDPEERFQSDWYRHYRRMFADVL